MNRVELFFNAVQQGQLETVEAQLKTNPELANAKDVRGFTPLIFASYFDKKDIVVTKTTLDLSPKKLKGIMVLVVSYFRYEPLFV